MKRWIRIFITAALALFMIPQITSADYPQPNQAATGSIEDLVLIYSGYYDPANYGGEDISAWPRSQFKPYTSFVDRQGVRQDTFFGDYLFLGLKSPYGHSFYRESTASSAGVKSDWQWFLDRIFTADTLQLNALNEETIATANDLNRPDLTNDVMIMVPFANENVTNFGDVDGDGISENLTTLSGREKVTDWYIDEAIARFNQGNYSHLSLKGFYWLQEDLDTSKQDEVSLVQHTASHIHNQGSYVFSWIPWSKAYAATSWASFGFDFAILQPNHFMNSNNTTTPATIKDASTKASNAGMGVELEFDGRILRSDMYRERFYDYLNGGVAYGYMNNSILGYYQDARGIYDLTQNPQYGYPIYEDLYRFVKGTYLNDKMVSSTLNTFESVPFGGGSGATASITQSQSVQGNASMQVDFGNYATAYTQGSYGTDFFIRDWSAFDTFRLDIYNPNTTTGYVTVVIGDGNGNQHYRYVDLYKNSWNTVRIPISDLAGGLNGSPEEPGTVPIDVSNIAYIKLVQRGNSNYLPLPNTYYFDNMRLVQDDGARLNNLEWLDFGGNTSVTLTKTQSTIREQNNAMQVDYQAYNVSQTWIEAPTHFKQQDWSGQEAFKVDIYNPNGAAMNLGLKFTDASGLTYYKRVSLQSGKWNTVQIPIADLASGANGTSDEGTSSALNIQSIQRVDFYQRSNSNYLAMPNRLYFDNVRLGVLE